MKNILDITKRLEQFIKHLGVSEREFARRVGLSSGYIGALKRGSTLGMDKVLKIISTFPELNMKWLVEGSGSMLLSDKNKQSGDSLGSIVMEETNPTYGGAPKRTEITDLKMKIHDLEIENKALKEALRQIGKGLNQ